MNPSTTLTLLSHDPLFIFFRREGNIARIVNGSAKAAEVERAMEQCIQFYREDIASKIEAVAVETENAPADSGASEKE